MWRGKKKDGQLPVVLAIRQPLEQRVLEDVAKREHALELVLLVDDDEAVDARSADGVVDGGELVLHGAGVYAGEVLCLVSIAVDERRRGWMYF